MSEKFYTASKSGSVQIGWILIFALAFYIIQFLILTLIGVSNSALTQLSQPTAWDYLTFSFSTLGSILTFQSPGGGIIVSCLYWFINASVVVALIFLARGNG